MRHYAAAKYRSLTVGIRLDVQKAALVALFRMGQVGVRFSVNRVIMR